MIALRQILNPLYFIILLNGIRFVALSYSPNGIFLDEAAGATQVMCIAQSGYDFFGNYFPLFAAGFEGQPGQFTPFYLYAQIAWTSLFGYNIAIFRGFSALVTCLTICLLYFFVKKRAGKKVAIYVAFAATVMPWAFQFSRIAWDPPLAVFFIVAFMFALDRPRLFSIAALMLALSAYTYPPMRIMCPLLLILFPEIKLKEKILLFLVFAIACIPLMIKLASPDFMLRANLHVIWSHDFENPYSSWGIFGLPILFLLQVIKHLTPSFLFLYGDMNLRHSIGTFGMLSYLDAYALILGIILLLYRCFTTKNSIFRNNEQGCLLKLALIGIVVGIVPSALTNQGIPHGLRSIGCWPYFAILTGLILSLVDDLISSRWFRVITISIGLIFFSAYIYQYFTVYVLRSAQFFNLMYAPIDYAYIRMQRDKLSCNDVRLEPAPKGNKFFFLEHGNGGEFLGSHWHDQESWGRWSDGIGGSIHIPYLAGSKLLEIKIRPLLGPKQPSQSVSIFTNGTLKKILFTNAGDQVIKLTLPSHLAPNATINVDFISDNPLSASQVGLGTDERPLGIGLISVEFK
jgi:hypothetical protein